MLTIACIIVNLVCPSVTPTAKSHPCSLKDRSPLHTCKKKDVIQTIFELNSDVATSLQTKHLDSEET